MYSSGDIIINQNTNQAFLILSAEVGGAWVQPVSPEMLLAVTNPIFIDKSAFLNFQKYNPENLH